MTAPGVHISFFDAGEAVDRELPGIGPLHGVLLRGDRLVIEDADVAVPDEPGIEVTRWLEGVVELRRATGETPGGRRRISMRVSAPDGLYLRFGAIDDPAAAMRELGPFARVFIGPRTIEASGDVLALRASPQSGIWTLTANADPNAVGARRPDVGFRSTSTPYHAWMNAPPMRPMESDPASSPAAERAPPRPAGIPAAPARLAAPSGEIAAPPAPAAPTAPAASAARSTPPAPAESRALKDSDIDLLQRRARRQKEEAEREQDRERQLGSAKAEGEARAAATAREAAATRDAALAREAALRQATARGDAAREEAKRDKKSKGGRGGKSKAATPREPAPQRESATSRHVARALASTDHTAETDGGLNWLELMWRLRFVLLAVLVAGVGAYGFSALQPRSSSAQPQERTYNLGQKFSSARWDYVVNGIQREPLAGTARPRGVYLAVRITLTNKGADGAQATPGDFAIVDAAGTRYGPESLLSGVYATPENRSPFEWPTSYPPGRQVVTRVVFDIDAGLRGLWLVISELPGTKVKIE